MIATPPPVRCKSPVRVYQINKLVSAATKPVAAYATRTPIRSLVVRVRHVA
jgi:hypothetical protein